MATEQDPPPTDARTAVKNLLIGSIRPLFFILLAIGVFWFISNQIGNGPDSILSKLNDTATARGLITFVVATATVAAAMILVLAAIISEGAEADVKMRLNEGRQVLAPLIGILGTIVGFYFGQLTPAANQPGAGQAQTLTVGAVTASAEQVVVGGKLTITSSVSGGRSPYTYTIMLPGVGQPIADKLGAAGELKREVTIPADAKASDGTIQLEVKDAGNATAVARSDKPLKVAPAPSPPK